MLDYKSFTLENGLRVLVHEDASTPIAVVNIMYNVGSRDEDPERTGFAHLFEHLMFGGSENIANFDEPLERVGGENNAFTSPDVTNYFITLPAVNLETAFWLESDRMLSLSFDPKVLEVQKKVVVEEFRQRYLNQPYGDIWFHLRRMAYKKHPYMWPTIGKDISHIENATMEEVKSFFNRFYLPNNAVMVVGGGVSYNQVVALAEKWFGDIPAGDDYIRDLPQEPSQNEKRFLEIESDVPLDALYKVYHMPGKLSEDYWKCDLLSDILGRGKSSRLYQKLVKQAKIFNHIQAYVTGSSDPGLLVISGKLRENSDLKEADQAVNDIIKEIQDAGTGKEELDKVKNQAEASHTFNEVELLNRCLNLSYAAIMGDPGLVNKEYERIRNVTVEDIGYAAEKYLKESNCSTLYYKSKSK